MKKKIGMLMTMALLICLVLTGCTEVDQVSSNISKEADNFNVTRKLTVLNARTDTILLEADMEPFLCRTTRRMNLRSSSKRRKENTRRIWSISMIIQCTLLKTFPVLM